LRPSSPCSPMSPCASVHGRSHWRGSAT